MEEKDDARDESGGRRGRRRRGRRFRPWRDTLVWSESKKNNQKSILKSTKENKSSKPGGQAGICKFGQIR